MKVYTKTGDNKQTSIIGQRIDKDSLRIECYGTTDEALSYIGLIATKNDELLIKEQLEYIIKLFFNIGNDLASINKDNYKINNEDVIKIESFIDLLSKDIPELTSFIGPQGCDLSCYCNITRTIIRRSERLIVALSKQEDINEIILKLINRLSDYFFTLMRYFNNKYNFKEHMITF
ncbi:MAG: cob(I)yrinic acid a,c-diamide adenosyltransferase [Bacilli bacterium]|jgi:cob(I)alamin adenosyltransferase|nr:cob(I)yrinic acid a,c-diamide adenosyltransferase [Bacilli bacterium]